MGGGAHGHILQLGFEIQHIGQAHPLGTAPVGDQQAVGLGIRLGLGRRLAQRMGLGDQGHLVQRGCQALAPHRLGQVVGGIDLEGAQRMLGVGGDKDHGGGCGLLLQLARQLHAAVPRHMDVQQQHIKGLAPRRGAGQRLQCLGGIGGLVHGAGRWCYLDQQAP